MFVRPARPFLLVGAAGLFAGAAAWTLTGGRTVLDLAVLVPLVGLWGFFAVFFRDPDRTPGPGVVSAADGRVLEVRRDPDRWRVAVFMNVTDVHVNRFPTDATVVGVDDSGSGFRPAYVPDADHNVQRRYRLETGYGPVDVVQMTGVVARRLVSLVRPNESYRKGERLGMILLGSRVDVSFPTETLRPTVQPGDRVRAGTSTIAVERP